MEARFHKRVRADLQEILARYYDVSDRLGDDFYAEFQVGLGKAVRNPQFFHFDRSELRRCNLDRFPYHFLYDVRGEHIRIWVLRHNRCSPGFGLRRFPR